MSFQVPDSSPPSTPNKSHSFLSNVSTTPSGAPPSKANSFTPLGPPPSTVFGSSQLGSRNLNSPDSLFTKSGHMKNDSIFGSSFASSAAPQFNNPPKSFAQSQFTNGTRFGESSNFGQSVNFASSQLSEMDEEQDGADNMETENTNMDSTNPFSFLDSLPPRPTAALGHRKSVFSSPESAKRPKLDRPDQPLRRRLLPKKDSAMASIVKNFAARSNLAPVDDPTEMIVQTEDEVCRMYDEFARAEENGGDLNTTMSETATRLTAAWKSCSRAGTSRPFGIEATIGPGNHAPNVVKAAFLGSLMLQLHHPADMDTLSNSGSRSLVLPGTRTYSHVPMPKVLLDWLDTNHIPQSADLQALKELEPNPTASSNFWEIINSGVLRGRFSEVLEILRLADFNYARSAMEDGLPQNGYRGTQLQNIQRCVNKALQILESCPGSRGNWDVRDAEWSMYRKRVVSAVADLKEFAEGDEPEIPASGNQFQAVNFGLNGNTGPNLSFTQSARMAESRVPWAIYQNIKSIYHIILGDVGAITAHAQDWVEATVGLTVWWDGDDDSQPRSTRTDDREDYLDRIGLAYSNATCDENAGFRVNSLSSLEVGLASVFEGNISGVVDLLQTWSLCVASAIAEVSTAGGWIDDGSLPGLREDDLMVLSYGGNRPTRVNKDDVLSAYAAGLSERETIQDEHGSRGGWEVALGVLSRLDDTKRMEKSVSELLDKLPLDTSAQMDKAVLLCGELGLENEGRRVAEVGFLNYSYHYTDCPAIWRRHRVEIGGLRSCTGVLCSGP